MTRADLLRLADRVEREEPSDEVNWCIQEAVQPTWRRTTAEPYTTSLDAAASLCPEAWHIVELKQAHDGSWVNCVLYKQGTGKSAQGMAATEPRARTAAALRARAQEMGDE